MATPTATRRMTSHSTTQRRAPWRGRPPGSPPPPPPPPPAVPPGGALPFPVEGTSGTDLLAVAGSVPAGGTEAGRSSAGGSVLTGTRGYKVGPRAAAQAAQASQRRDQPLDAVVVRAERVLEQHGPLRLVVQLQVDPVDGEVAPALLRSPHEGTSEPRPGGLRRLGHRRGDLGVLAGALDLLARLELVEEPAGAVHVVVHEIGHGRLGMRERDLLALADLLDQAVLGDPVALAPQRQ